MALGILT